MPESIQVPVGDSSVTALVYAAPDPAPPHPTVILAHGAGLPQTSPFMVDFAKGLARRGCQAVTFNFPYTEQHRRLPDRAPVLEGCFREVVAAVRARPVLATGPLVIGGKSMGGRMATHLAAQGLADLAGVVVLGYPLHPPGRPQQRRAEHLARIRQPMLVVHHEQDPCRVCPPNLLPELMKKLSAARSQLITYTGGRSEGPPCEAFSHHGFNGIEERVVGDISAWIAARS